MKEVYISNRNLHLPHTFDLEFHLDQFPFFSMHINYPDLLVHNDTVFKMSSNYLNSMVDLMNIPEKEDSQSRLYTFLHLSNNGLVYEEKGLDTNQIREITGAFEINRFPGKKILISRDSFEKNVSETPFSRYANQTIETVTKKYFSQ